MVVGRFRRRRRNYPVERQRRVFRDRENPLEMYSEGQVWQRYRFRPQTILFLAGILSEELQHSTDRNKALPPLLQICLALRYLSSGTFAVVVGDTVPRVSPPTAWRAIQRVVIAIIRVLGDQRHYIKFPDPQDEQSLVRLKQGFFRVAGFPNVIGIVDGTHVRVEPPAETRNNYINRKGYPSLNCQMVCDHRKRFLDVVVKFPGSAHDSRIWRESSLGRATEANMWPDCFILGDTAYYQRVFMMTPYLDPENEVQADYNTVHAVTRALIEQTFGIAKRRFALMKTGTRVRTMGKAAREILACCLLHNFGIDEGDLMPEEPDNQPHNPASDRHFHHRENGSDAALGQALRDQIAASIHRSRHQQEL